MRLRLSRCGGLQCLTAAAEVQGVCSYLGPTVGTETAQRSHRGQACPLFTPQIARLRSDPRHCQCARAANTTAVGAGKVVGLHRPWTRMAVGILRDRVRLEREAGSLRLYNETRRKEGTRTQEYSRRRERATEAEGRPKRGEACRRVQILVGHGDSGGGDWPAH